MELNTVKSVKHLGGHRLELTFDDGLKGTIDLGDMVELTGVFEPLADEAEVAKVYVDDELGSNCWPHGADLDPQVLYDRVRGASFDAA